MISFYYILFKQRYSNIQTCLSVILPYTTHKQHLYAIHSYNLHYQHTRCNMCTTAITPSRNHTATPFTNYNLY